MTINDIIAMGGKLAGIDATAIEKYIKMADDEIYLYLSSSCSGFLEKKIKTIDLVSGASVSNKRIVSAVKKGGVSTAVDKVGNYNYYSSNRFKNYNSCCGGCANPVIDTSTTSCENFNIEDNKIYFDTSETYTVSYIDTSSLLLPKEFKTLYSDIVYRNFLIECKSMTDMTGVANAEQFILRGFENLKTYLKNKGCCGSNTTTIITNPLNYM